MYNEKQYRKDYYLKNKDKILARQKIRRGEKGEYIKEYQDRFYKTKKGRIVRGLASIKRRATVKGMDFDIDLEFLRSIAPDKCPVFGFELDWNNWGNQNGTPQENTPTIDRIDSNKGYLRTNVVWVSWKANRLKNNATYEDLMTIAKWLKKINKRAQ